ncbi:MAG TPA: DCC1-like thiol-disulfide oxidoreductase family protein [Acidimicrobiales bacterium]|nr:DCC1-like thiol-disulfide oxidoreductase family protein [Acidimicrobiales bacterium]
MDTRPLTVRSPRQLTVVYDDDCELCRRCSTWLRCQPTHVPIELLPVSAAREEPRYQGVPWLGAELVVIDGQGRIWVGAAAFLVCLWATRDWREWSYRLSGPSLAPLAERFFHAISAHRGRIGAFLGPTTDDCGVGRCAHA